MNWYSRFRILPLMMTVVLFSLLVRVHSAEQNAQKGLFITTSVAQASAPKSESKKKDDSAIKEAKPEISNADKELSKPEAKKSEHGEGEEKKSEEKKSEEKKPEDKKGGDKKEGDKKDGENSEEKKPADPLDLSTQEMRPSGELAVLQDLADRRKQLETREAALNEREALIQVSEKQFETKVRELTSLRDEIKKLMDTANAKQTQETTRLIAVYEKMKPSDAAGIFNSLNMDVLVPILQGMKEAKLSPVLAAMTPDKAKQVTNELANRAKVLPTDTPVRAAAEAAATAALPPLPPGPQPEAKP